MIPILVSTTSLPERAGRKVQVCTAARAFSRNGFSPPSIRMSPSLPLLSTSASSKDLGGIGRGNQGKWYGRGKLIAGRRIRLHACWSLRNSLPSDTLLLQQGDGVVHGYNRSQAGALFLHRVHHGHGASMQPASFDQAHHLMRFAGDHGCSAIAEKNIVVEEKDFRVRPPFIELSRPVFNDFSCR